MGRRCLLFAGSVTRMEDTGLPKCGMFGELVSPGHLIFCHQCRRVEFHLTERMIQVWALVQ